MTKILNLTASGRKISDGEMVVRKVFAEKYASPTRPQTERQDADKLASAKIAIKQAMRQGNQPSTGFAKHVQSKQLENKLAAIVGEITGAIKQRPDHIRTISNAVELPLDRILGSQLKK